MKIFSIFLGFLSTVLIVVVIILVLLLIQSNKELTALRLGTEVSDLPLEIADPNESDEAPVVTTLNFIDTGLDINIEYPSDWSWELDTDISDDFGSGAYKEIHTYDLDFTKGSNKIEFSAIFGGVGDVGVQYPDSQYDTEVLSSELIRVKEDGQTEWRYLSKIPCTDAMEWDGVTEVCGAGGFFPGFADGGASAVSYTGSDSLLDEVDAIVLTAAN
jgi:hypothetical protein